MAKKAKTIEIKNVPAEPQRGAGQDASLDDPVGIYYPFGGIARLIGSLAGGEEDEAVIKTGGCIVEHDINIRYSAPPAETLKMTAINGSGDADDFIFSSVNAIFTVSNDEIISVGDGGEIEGYPDYIAPVFNSETYVIGIAIPRDEDNLIVTINNQTVTYDNRVSAYISEVTFDRYPETLNIEINVKR